MLPNFNYVDQNFFHGACNRLLKKILAEGNFPALVAEKKININH